MLLNIVINSIACGFFKSEKVTDMIPQYFINMIS